MRFSTILAASTMALLSVISAQSTVPDPAMTACNTCVTNAGIATSPSCKGLETTHNSGSSELSAKHKSCWCVLAANKNWLDGCVGPDKCTATMKDTIISTFNLATSQPGFCDGVSTTSAAGARFCGASSAKVAAAGAAALAVAGALL